MGQSTREVIIQLEGYLYSLPEGATFSRKEIERVYPDINKSRLASLFYRLHKDGVFKLLAYNKWVFTHKPIPDKYKKFHYRSGLDDHEKIMKKAQKLARRKNKKHVRVIKDLGFEEYIPLLQKV